MIRLAKRIGLVDRPDGHRKLHIDATALGGGVAVWLACIGAVLCAWLIYDQGVVFSPSIRRLLALLGASLTIVAVGVADDRYRLRGRHKLLGQAAAAMVLIGSGTVIQRVSFFDMSIEMGVAAIPITLFWLVGAMNSVNLIDGIDGLASTVGIILSATIGGLALMLGHTTEAYIAFAFGGSLAGFLCFNFPPARIFLGDAGSLLIGLVIGSLALWSSIKGPATVAMAAPLAVWAIPILDSFAAIVRRKLTGRSIYTPDRGHLQHRLMEIFGSNRRVLIVVALGCMGTCGAGLVSVYMRNDVLALVGVVCVIAILVATRLFGYVEFMMLTKQLHFMSRNLMRSRQIRLIPRPHISTMRLQGTRKWDQLWELLSEFAEKLSLYRMQLDVNLPRVHESYHAFWQKPGYREPMEMWRTEIPLFAAGQQLIGRLSVVGECDQGSCCELVEKLMDLLEPFETQLIELAAGQHIYNPADEEEASDVSLATAEPE